MRLIIVAVLVLIYPSLARTETYTQHAMRLAHTAASGDPESALQLWSERNYILSDKELNRDLPISKLIKYLEEAEKKGNAKASYALFQDKAKEASNASEFNLAFKYLERAFQLGDSDAAVLYAIYLALDFHEWDDSKKILESVALNEKKRINLADAKKIAGVWNNYPDEEVSLLIATLKAGRDSAIEFAFSEKIDNGPIQQAIFDWFNTSWTIKSTERIDRYSRPIQQGVLKFEN